MRSTDVEVWEVVLTPIFAVRERPPHHGPPPCLDHAPGRLTYIAELHYPPANSFAFADFCGAARRNASRLGAIADFLSQGTGSVVKIKAPEVAELVGRWTRNRGP